MLDIDTHTTLDEVVRKADTAEDILENLFRENIPVQEILASMSDLHERLNRDVIALCEKQMIDEGYGPPPVNYCWINLGSDARREQTLRTDQDNALIYADPMASELEKTDQYFAVLADKIVHALDQCGFDLCTGHVMATNPVWRRSISQWASYIEQWSKSLDPEDSITMTILLDFRPIWGDLSLGRKLWYHIFRAFQNPEKMNHMLTQEDFRFEIPLNLIGHIRTIKAGPCKDQVNIKTGGLVHLINGARIFAVNNRITETSTLERFTQLAQLGVLPEKQAGYFITAFETLLRFRIRSNLEKLARHREPDNCIDPATLCEEDARQLRNALISVSWMQKLIRNRFTQIALNFFS